MHLICPVLGVNSHVNTGILLDSIKLFMKTFQEKSEEVFAVMFSICNKLWCTATDLCLRQLSQTLVIAINKKLKEFEKISFKKLVWVKFNIHRVIEF